jgi:hypothetical protein
MKTRTVVSREYKVMLQAAKFSGTHKQRLIVFLDSQESAVRLAL